MSNRPPLLQDIRILDLSTVIAAPFAATLCADLGASVTKIELPDGSDALRGLAPTTPEHALYWKTVNRGKAGITLDVRTPSGKDLFLRILKNTDVLVENFRTGTLDRWGCNLATLLAANPNLIVLRLTGFGQTGPYAERPGFARIFEAMSGLTNLIGTPESGPQHPNVPIGDLIAGLFGAFSIASAIASLRRGTNRTHVGNRASYTAPSNMYKSRDGKWVTLVASSDAIFKRLCRAINKPDWSENPEFSTNPKRCVNVTALDEGIAEWFADHQFDEIAKTFDESAIPYTKVYDIADVASDPQVISRKGIINLVDPDLGEIPAPCPVPRVPGIKETPIRSGPKTGEDNLIFYKNLGLSDLEISDLQKDRVI